MRDIGAQDFSIGRILGFFAGFIFTHKLAHFVRPRFWQRNAKQERRQLFVQFFGANERFLASNRFAFACAAVVGVIMHIAVFLVFGVRFCSKHHTARAIDQTAEWFWIVGFSMLFAALFQDGLYVVKKLFRNNSFVFALVGFTEITKMPVIKRVRQHTRDARSRIRLFACCFLTEQFASFGFYAVGIQKLGNLVEALVAFGVQLKCLGNNRRDFLVYFGCLGAHIVVIANRC